MGQTFFTFVNTSDKTQQWSIGYGNSFTLTAKNAHQNNMDNSTTQVTVTVGTLQTQAKLQFSGDKWSVSPTTYFTIENQGDASATLKCSYNGSYKASADGCDHTDKQEDEKKHTAKR